MRKGILAFLLTVSAGSGWATGQQYQPVYGQPSLPSTQLVPPHTYSQYGRTPQRIPAYRGSPHYVPTPGYQSRTYPTRPSTPVLPVSQPHPLSNGSSPPITILPETDVARPLPNAEAPAPEILLYPSAPNAVPNAPRITNDDSEPNAGELLPAPTKDADPRLDLMNPKAGVEQMPTADEPPAPGSAILYGTDELTCIPECYPECPEPAPITAPPVIPPVKPLGYKFYGSAGYLFWWVKGQSSPVLLNIGPVGSPATTSIGGGAIPFDNRQRNGVRGTVGMWLDRDQFWALEGSGLYLFDRSPAFDVVSPPAPDLSRPFFRIPGGAPAAAVVSSPGILDGAAHIESFHRLWGAEVNLRRNLLRRQSWWLDVLGGFRWLELDERLGVETDSQSLATGSTLTVSDRFGARNEFMAGQFGLQGEWQFWRMFVNAYGKFAFGRNLQIVHVEGGRAITGADGTVTNAVGGFLAQKSNIGRHTQNQFCFLPEVGANIGFALSDSVRVTAGYTFLYLTNVARPGNQINPNINTTQSTPNPAGPPAPLFHFVTENYWAQGLNFTLQIRY